MFVNLVIYLDDSSGAGLDQFVNQLGNFSARSIILFSWSVNSDDVFLTLAVDRGLGEFLGQRADVFTLNDIILLRKTIKAAKIFKMA